MRRVVGYIMLGLAVFVGVILVTHVFGKPEIAAQPKAAVAVNGVGADEAGALITACGAPRVDRDETTAGDSAEGLSRRMMRYPQFDFQFARTASDNWTMTGAFKPDRDDSLSRDQVAGRMPCTRKVKFSNALF